MFIVIIFLCQKPGYSQAVHSTRAHRGDKEPGWVMPLGDLGRQVPIPGVSGHWQNVYPYSHGTEVPTLPPHLAGCQPGGSEVPPH